MGGAARRRLAVQTDLPVRGRSKREFRFLDYRFVAMRDRSLARERTAWHGNQDGDRYVANEAAIKHFHSHFHSTRDLPRTCHIDASTAVEFQALRLRNAAGLAAERPAR